MAGGHAGAEICEPQTGQGPVTPASASATGTSSPVPQAPQANASTAGVPGELAEEAGSMCVEVA